VIGHLSARMIGGRPPIEFDMSAIYAAAVATGTALEVNGALPRLDVTGDAIRGAKGTAVTFVLTSDAHHVSELENVRHAAMHAERAWIHAGNVINVGSADRMLAWAQSPKRGAVTS